MELDRFTQYNKKDIDFLKWRTNVPYIFKGTQRLIDFIFQDRPEAVLEIGCGEGITLQYTNPVKYIGVDTSLVRLGIASLQNKKHTFIQGDGTSLPFWSGQFDLVFCMGTLHHLSKQGAFLMIQEMTRVCKKGGQVAITEPNVYNPSSLLLGLLRKPERGILHCKPKIFLKYFKRFGKSEEIKLKYYGTFYPICLSSYFFKNRDFVNALWFQKIWERTDYIVNKIIPQRFWTGVVIMGKKGCPERTQGEL